MLYFLSGSGSRARQYRLASDLWGLVWWLVAYRHKKTSVDVCVNRGFYATY